jgi:hypothetical protein
MRANEMPSVVATDLHDINQCDVGPHFAVPRLVKVGCHEEVICIHGQ